MRRLFILGLFLCAALAGDVAAKKPSKKKPKSPSGEAIAKAVFVGELFPSGNLYLYALAEKPGAWPKSVSFFVVDPQGPAPTPVAKAELDAVIKGTKLVVLEDGKSTAMVAQNTVRDFVRYKADRAPSAAVVIIAIAGFEIDGVTLARNEVPRPVTAAEKRAAEKWYADWKKEFKKVSGEEYNEEQDEMFGRPETLADAKRVAAITFASSDQLVEVSRWSSRDAAQVGYVWFVVDVSRDDKILKTVKAGIPTGPLG
jgi:hypothetical protein